MRATLRAPNRDGFLDADHAPAKPPGVVRVGFFGDSYVEALQVPLEDTFFRKLPTAIAGSTLEPFAFGISGWGTLHALLAYRVMGRRYDLDEVVYLFVGNDPGDNSYRVKPDQEASAELSDEGIGGFTLRTAPPRRTAARWARDSLERTSLLARIVRVRMTVHRAVNQQRRTRTAPPEAQAVNQNDRPSTWPPTMLAEAKTLTRRILTQFRDEVVRDGRRFAVLYVPRGPKELKGQLRPQDSWLPWLSQTCAELGIPLWNPHGLLSARQRAGTVIYNDHWTPEAHQLMASFIADQLAAAR
jgi:hypothetical protein